jgi:phosphatidylinositol alpha 1,6-mannosyltransferase
LNQPLRVALFTDSFYETNGVARVSAEFAAFAERSNFPFFCVRAGPENATGRKGSVRSMDLKRSLASFPLDKDLDCDLLLNRYRNRLIRAMTEFQPDLIHITGPGDLGVLGFWVAHVLGVPLVASWHTNLHEYASRRLYGALSFAPDRLRNTIAGASERWSLRALMAFYRLAHFTLAPNPAMVELLRAKTGRPAYSMEHGVDLNQFSQAERRNRTGPFRIGYVGRLTVEKNVRDFVNLQAALESAGQHDFQLVLVGDGRERGWLRRHLPQAEMPGILRGEQLAAAYAGMDAFVFPSRTDTFGLVILEAMASGVPVLATRQTGARVGIHDGVEGFLSDDFASGILSLIHSETLRFEMGHAAREFACSKDWDTVFRSVYRTYEEALETSAVRDRLPSRFPPEVAGAPTARLNAGR